MTLSISKTESTSNTNLRDMLTKLQKAVTTSLFESGTLADGSGDTKKIKLTSTIHYKINDVIYQKTTAEVAFTATTHDCVQNKFAVYAVTINAAGTLTITKGDEVASAALALAGFPAIPVDQVLIGFLLGNPTSGAFTANTSDASVLSTGTAGAYVDTPLSVNSLVEAL